MQQNTVADHIFRKRDATAVVSRAQTNDRVVAMLVPSTESMERRLTQAPLQQFGNLHCVQGRTLEQLIA